MLKLLMFLLLCINVVYAVDPLCESKYLHVINQDNFNILVRNITNVDKRTMGHEPERISLENNGHTVIMRFFYNTFKPSITGGPYGKDKYQLDFMYFNWLEEKVNTTKETLPFELHLVFVNEKYGTYERAQRKNFGITIWSYRYKLKDLKDNVYADQLYNNLQHIREPNSKFEMNSLLHFLTPVNMLVKFSLEYFTYQGRLMPFMGDCKTDVIWIEYPLFIDISDNHVLILQQLMSFNDTPLMSQVEKYGNPTGPIYQNIDYYAYEENGLSAQGFDYFNATFDDSDDDDDSISLSSKLQLSFSIILLGFSLTIF